MNMQLDTKVKEMTLESLDEFLSSLRGEPSALNNFVERWASFANTVQDSRHSLQEDTLGVVNDLAIVISTIATGILNLHVESETINQETEDDISQILSGLQGLAVFEEKGIHVCILSLILFLTHHCLLLKIHIRYRSIYSRHTFGFCLTSTIHIHQWKSRNASRMKRIHSKGMSMPGLWMLGSG